LRTELSRQEYLGFGRKSSLKIVTEWQQKYQAIDEVLRKNRGIFQRAHEDFCEWLSESAGGRKSTYTTDEIVRTIIVMFVESDGYRDVVIRIDGNLFLRTFVGLGPFKQMMDFTFLSRAFSALRPETLSAINEELARYAWEEEMISQEKLRADTTVYETNVHYPTDSALLWDCFRVMSEWLKWIQSELGDLPVRHRFHVKKAKRRMYYIARYAGSPSKQRKKVVKRKYRKLIKQVRWIIGVSEEIRDWLQPTSELAILLMQYEELAQRVVEQTESRVLRGITVPADQKVYSIFEPHTELIKRGKAGKPVEFGHKILLAQTGEKFISLYEVFEKRPEDNTLVPLILGRHHALFEEGPETLSLDQGFYESMQALNQLRDEIPNVAIRKKGKANQKEKEIQSTEEFKDGQRFRAGIEGTISVLKRGFKLDRCLFKGFKNYAVSVGFAVLCHNLVLLTKL